MRATEAMPLPYRNDSGFRRLIRRNLGSLAGIGLIGGTALIGVCLASWHADDPSLSNAVSGTASNLLGYPGAVVADLAMQFLGIAAPVLLLPALIWGWRLLTGAPLRPNRLTVLTWLAGVVLATMAAGTLPVPEHWPLPTGLGGVTGDLLLQLPGFLLGGLTGATRTMLGVLLAALATALIVHAAGFWSVPLPGLARRSAAASVRPARRRPAPVPVITADDRFDETDADEEDRPSRFAVIAGLAAHTAYSAGAMGRRLFGASRRTAAGLTTRSPAGNRRRRTPEPSVIADEDDGFDPRARHAGEHPYRATADYADDMGDGDYGLPGYPDAGYDDDFRGDADPGFDADYAWPDGPDDFAPAGREEPAPPMRAPVRAPAARGRAAPASPAANPGRRPSRRNQAARTDRFELPPLELLAAPKQARGTGPQMSPEALAENARLLESVLDDFGVRGEIIHVRPGPVVTLYELEPAPGIKSSRVIGLADDIARSMSAIACRVAVIPGKNAIGIELPNQRRETVFLRELLAAPDFAETKARLPLCLGKTIGGEPVIADLARMPHLLIAGTTGSGKSVSVNTMILSLLYRLTPQECRLIMIDPKMLELSTYDGIPHLLTPVVTDPKKAVVALKWTVREMEDRYRKMSKVGVRNIDGLNARIAQAQARGETLARTVQTGFDPETGEPIIEREELALEPMPYIVVIIDEMADLMMVAGKDIEGAVQRLAQMARAAGIHVVMATQRPSVDVITGTIKANFPTRISFQVTSKIDSRTILGEQGAEQLLGQGDMLYMMGGGRITRVHGPFVSDEEVDGIVAHLKTQGVPDYLDAITAEDDEDSPVDGFAEGGLEESNDLYDKAVAVVLRDRKASTSYVQRRLQIGYNRAASLIERMEKEGVVGPANHAGKREILVEAQEERF